MIKYLSETIERLKALKNGMEKNAALWKPMTETPAKVQLIIDGLNTKEAQILNLKDQLAIAQSEGHNLSNDGETYASKIESLAIGLEGDNPDKLLAYGIKPRKPSVKRPAPTKLLIPIIEDDSNGIGFTIYTQTDPDADMYEWEKGAGANASVTDIIPEMKLYKTTTKTLVSDHDIPKGIRLFYKVRAVNAAGPGPWSEAVSKVQ